MQENKGISRRQALQSLGLVGAGAVLSSCLGPVAIAQKPDIDVAVLNFALNLEYLEAEFYLRAVGRTPSYATSGSGTEGAVTGGSTVTFSSPDVREMMEEIAADEEAHVKFLRSALGSAAVARPAINFTDAFVAAGKAASNNAISNFNPFANELFFLHGAFVFEDVGVTAYKGAAPALTNATFLEAAAGILGVEAYHAGEIRTLLYQQRAQSAAAGLNVQQVVQAISNLRDSVDGADDRDQGIVGGGENALAPAGKANIVPTDENGIAFSRTTSQVLRIVYLGMQNMGGFFPNGLNGTIKAAS
jgi:hypothetical protein